MMPSGHDNDEIPLFTGKHLQVRGASPRRMLALKVSSLRDKDWKDIKPLMTATGATTFGQIKTLVEDEYKTAGPGAAALLRLRLPELERGLDQKKHETSWQAEMNRIAPPSKAVFNEKAGYGYLDGGSSQEPSETTENLRSDAQRKRGSSTKTR
ncbi:MAG: hypothetical protein OXG35_26620 [Acidobacteria bacterium]|nr:hypothetical protein [Acidobacteriota bacterium]